MDMDNDRFGLAGEMWGRFPTAKNALLGRQSPMHSPHWGVRRVSLLEGGISAWEAALSSVYLSIIGFSSARMHGSH